VVGGFLLLLLFSSNEGVDVRIARRARRKNIKIAPPIGGAAAAKRISFSLFAPFNFLFSETEKKLQCQKNQKVTKICQKKSTSVPSAVR
jgi:hypothetical protein